jgi:hypothetical protein
LIAAALSFVGVEFYVTQAKLARELRVAMSTDIFSAPVDLSKPGTYTVKFDCASDLTHGLGHGQVLYLEMTPRAPYSVVLPLLEGVEATFMITDADGNEIAAQDVGGPPGSASGPHALAVEAWGAEGPSHPAQRVVRLLFMRAPVSGTYTLGITVKRGAVGLQGAGQRVFARYHLCGLEVDRVKIAQLLSTASFALAGIIIIVILAITRRERRRARQAALECSGSDAPDSGGKTEPPATTS